MKMNKKTLYFGIAGVGAFLFLLLIILLKTVDVAAVGPMGTSVGFSSINASFQAAHTFNKTFYTISKLLGVLTIATAAFFAGVGVFQWIKRKKLLKVDLEIRVLAVLYAAIVVLYVFFEKVVINYRPMIMPDGDAPEPSFPSTHTFLVCMIMGSAIFVFNRLIKNDMLRTIAQIACGVIIVVMIVSRLLSGVHWLTDIIGGVLLSTALVFAYAGVVTKKHGKRKSH